MDGNGFINSQRKMKTLPFTATVMIFLIIILIIIKAEPLPDEELNDMNKKQLRLEQKSNIKDTPIFFEISENSFICIETDCNIIEYNDDEVFGEPKKLCNCEEEESNDAPITGCGLVNQQYFIELLSTCQMKYKCNCNYINYHSIVPETLGISN